MKLTKSDQALADRDVLAVLTRNGEAMWVTKIADVTGWLSVGQTIASLKRLATRNEVHFHPRGWKVGPEETR